MTLDEEIELALSNAKLKNVEFAFHSCQPQHVQKLTESYWKAGYLAAKIMDTSRLTTARKGLTTPKET
jgi:hypothetical protein